MSAEAKNFEAIVKVKDAHNKNCPFPPHTVRMNPFEIERMQWEEGDTIAGLVLEADPKLGTGAFRLICDGMDPLSELSDEQRAVMEDLGIEALTVSSDPIASACFCSFARSRIDCAYALAVGEGRAACLIACDMPGYAFTV